MKKFRWAIDEYNARNRSQRTPNIKYCAAMKKRPKFSPMSEQPAYLGKENNLKLRDYQLAGLNWLVHSWSRSNSVILADEIN